MAHLCPRAFRLFGLVAVLGLGQACTDNEDPEGAAVVWKLIHVEGYRDWQRAPGYPGRRPSNAPHGNSVEIFINDTVAHALDADAGTEEWPVGSIIVKDGYDDGDLDLVAVMHKQTDGWFWAEYDSEGDPSYSGTPELCTDCHASGDDFVRAFSREMRVTP